MGNLPPFALDAGFIVGAVIVYGAIWYASRGLSRFAQVIARLMPLMLVIPVLLLLQTQRTQQASKGPNGTRTAQPAERAPDTAAPTQAAPPSAPSPPPVERRVEIAPPPPVTTPAPETAPSPERRADVPAPEVAPKPTPPADTSPEAKPAEPRAGEPAQREADWDVVPVFYGTDRLRQDEAGKRLRYTADRGRRLDLGRALVTVPRSHQVPNIERPFALRVPYLQITVYEQAEDPKQHFTIKDLAALSREEFMALARERILGGNAFKDQAIVFVHGYNTEFDYALYRSAQMAYDLKFDGATFLYSWPSAGDVTGYVYDRESSEQSEPYLREFLDMVLRDTGAKSVSVIAHSMGNLPLLRVLQTLGPQLPADVRLNQIILAAPDVDRDVFANLASTIRPYGRGVTLYCSSNDRAMAAARRVAGGIPRAGDVSADGPVVVDGIDTIDVSQTSTEYLALNHSTYAETSALLNDIGLLLTTGERPPEARIPILQRIATPKGDFWRYPAVR